MNEQPLNLVNFLRALRRYRLLVVALVILGLAGGVGLAVSSPPVPTARALVILPDSGTTSSGLPDSDMPTQVIIATSTPVLAAAGTAVSPPIGPTVLEHDVIASSLSDQVLQIQVTAKTSREAVLLANAVATGYVAYLTKAGSVGSTVLAPLQHQAAVFTKQVLALQAEINAASARLTSEKASSPAGQQDAALLGNLRSEQEEVSLQLNNINSEIVTAQLANSANASATQVLQKAELVPTSQLRTAALGGVGASIGLLLGFLMVLARSSGDRRLRLRDEIAGAVGLPVVASLAAARCSSAKDWKRLVEGYRPPPVDAWNARRVFHRLTPVGLERRLELTVVTFADDVPALACGAELSMAAAEAGMMATLEVGEHPSLALLRTACSLQDKSLVFETEDAYATTDEVPEFSGLRITVSVVAVDVAKPALPQMTGTVLLALSSGFATAEALARVALAAGDGGNPVDGIVVINPEPSDSTAGSVGAAQSGKPRRLASRGSHRASPELAAGRSR